MTRPLHALPSFHNFSVQRIQVSMNYVSTVEAGPELGLQAPTSITETRGQGSMSMESREKKQRHEWKQTWNHVQLTNSLGASVGGSGSGQLHRATPCAANPQPHCGAKTKAPP